MSDPIKHECGIALVRLLKPPAYYLDKYGTALYGFNKLFLLMEKQHNRGQDGAGVATVKFDMPPGEKYLAFIEGAHHSFGGIAGVRTGTHVVARFGCGGRSGSGLV